MVKKFFEYLNESSDSSIPYFFSRKLSDFLLEIVSTSQDIDVVNFTKEILKIESRTDVKSSFTFVDMTEKNDMVSMIQPNRVYSIWKKSGANQEFKDWISMEKIYPNSQVWTTNRSQISVGRAFRKISTDGKIKSEDRTIENFVNGFKSLYDFKWNLDGRFELVEGELIRKWYNKENYASRSGQLGNSCMRYESCSSYFDIYVYNPKVCKLLVLYDDPNRTLISGRALIWKTESGETYVDRIYTNKDSDIKLFENYVEKLGWTTKWSYSRSVKLEVWDFEKYPYMDSFSILDIKSGILTTDEDSWPNDDLYLLRQTDGSYISGKDLVYSEYSNDYINRSDAINIDDDWIRTSDAIYLEYKDEYIHPNDDYHYSNYFGDNILPDDAVYSKIMSDNLFIEKSIEIQVGSRESNSKIENISDYIVKTDDSLIEEVVYYVGDEQKIGKSLPELIVENPKTGVNYLLKGLIICKKSGDGYLTQKDAEILGIDLQGNSFLIKSTSDYITSLVKTQISKEDLDKFILNSNFDIRDHLNYIKKLDELYHQPFFGANPRLMKFNNTIQRHTENDESSERLNNLIKICLTNWDLEAWLIIKDSNRVSHFDVNKLHRNLDSLLISGTLSSSSNLLSNFNAIDVFKSFQLSEILKKEVINKKEYLSAWYYHYQFKQN